MAEKKNKKVVIIGIDGATFDIIQPMIEKGLLPNISRLMSDGCTGPLNSTTPPITYPAWTSFMTGKNPGKHGIFDFTIRKKGTYEVQLVNARQRRSPTFWRLLSDAGYRVGAMAIPVTFPPEEVNGFMISGFDAPGMTSPIPVTYPPGLGNELQKELGEYIVSLIVHNEAEKGRYDEVLKKLYQIIDNRTAAALYVLKKYAPDCFMVVYGETDKVSHLFWHLYDEGSPYHDPSLASKYRDAIFSVYKRVDDSIGELLNLIDEETIVLLMSDHGSGGAGSAEIYLNNWLASKGFLSFKQSMISSAKSNLTKLMRTYGLRFVPPRIKGKIMRSSLVSVVNRLESTIRFSSIDWSGTKAYSEESPYYPNIWINLQGREPEGIVSMEDYESVRDEVIMAVEGFVNPYTGQPVVKKAFRREEVYKGDFVENSPDIIIEWDDDEGYTYQFGSSKSEQGLLIVQRDNHAINRLRFGSHRQHGICIASGNGIEKSHRIEGADIMDLAPTILYILGAPVPDDMDGKVLEDLFEKEYLEKNPRKKSKGISSKDTSEIESYSAEDAEVISERLKGLGYL